MKSLNGFLFKRGILKTIGAIGAIGFNTRLKNISFNTKLMGSWMIGAIGFNTRLKTIGFNTKLMGSWMIGAIGFNTKLT